MRTNICIFLSLPLSPWAGPKVQGKGSPMEDSRFNIWDTQALARIGEVLEKLARLQVTDQGLDSNPHQTVRESYVGAFRYSVAEPSRVGPFQTIEALFPFLLFPSTQQYLETILQGLRHVLMELEESQDGGVRPFPEFESKWHDTAVDSTAFGLYVFALARNFFRTLPPEKRRKLGGIQNNVDTAIRKMIAYLEKNSNTDGWGFARGLANRVYSTALVATSLSYCEPGDFEAGQTHQEELIAKTVRYIDRMQIKEHKNHDESVQCIAGCPYGGWSLYPGSLLERNASPEASQDAVHRDPYVSFIWGLFGTERILPLWLPQPRRCKEDPAVHCFLILHYCCVP